MLGSYVLLEPLGEGGMGAVFKARHRRLCRVVALKIIRKERLADADAVRRLYASTLVCRGTSSFWSSATLTTT